MSPNATPAPEACPDITATPQPDQKILHDGKHYTTVKEGLAHILIPASSSAAPLTDPKSGTTPQSVFYNPIQQFNRDLSVLAIRAYGEAVVKKRQADAEKRAQSQRAKREKKRKRDQDGVGEAPRKAGKVEHTGDTSAGATTETKDTEMKSPDQVETETTNEVPTEATANSTSTPAEASPPSEVKDSKVESNEAGVQSMDKEAAEAKLDEKPQSDSTPKTFNPKFTILDALSATGLRALRYAHEIPFTTSVTANDLLKEATNSIKLNVQHNKLESKITAVTGDARAHMYNLACEAEDPRAGPIKSSQKYDVIDLDPYGTAAPFLDAAVQAVRDGGLLCVTCTDAGVFASNSYPEKAFSLYGGTTVKGMQSHEGGLRLILHAIATSAARYGLSIEPLLSLSIDFYARVFVKVKKSAADVKYLAGKTMLVYNCDSGCGAWTTQLLVRNRELPNKNGSGTFIKHTYALAPTTGEFCAHCGTKTHLSGPMYAGHLHSASFIRQILDLVPTVSKDTYATTERIEGMLNLALEEMLPAPAPADNEQLALAKAKESQAKKDGKKDGEYDPVAIDHYPFFFIPSVLSKVIHCITPDENSLRGALRHLGYKVTRSHTKPGSIKTDAPWEVIWHVMREWARQKYPIKEGAIKPNTAGWRIMGYDKKSDDAEKGDLSNGASAADEPAPPEVVFDEKLGRERDAKKLVRYQVNPRENWGPMKRAEAKN